MARKTAEETARTRQQIMDGARELFIRRGYNATSMEDIRSHANVSKGSIYYHFRSKKELFMQIVEQNMVDWVEGLRQIVKPDMSTIEKLYVLADYWMEDRDDPLMQVVEEFVTSHGGEPGTIAKLVGYVQLQYPPIQAIMEEGMEAGVFRQDDPAELAYIFVSLMGGLGMTYYDNVPLEQAHAMYRKAVDLFIHGIGAK